MQVIQIRRATKDDAGLLANLSWQTFFDTYAAFNTKEDMQLFLNTNFTKPTVAKELLEPTTHFFLAYIKREVVGYVKLNESENPEGLTGRAIEISRLYSSKNKIGSGVGKALMEHCISCAKEHQFNAIWLSVWSENQRAINFYRRFGFEKFGDYKFVLGTDVQDDWLMKLELN